MKYIVEVWWNETNSILIHDVIFIDIVGHIIRLTRLFDEPFWSLNEIYKVEIKAQP